MSAAACPETDCGWTPNVLPKSMAPQLVVIHRQQRHGLQPQRPTDAQVASLAELGEAISERSFPEAGDGRYLQGVVDGLFWVLGWADAPVLPAPDDTCSTCMGTGGWCRTRDAAGGEYDEDTECTDCGGSGVRS